MYCTPTRTMVRRSGSCAGTELRRLDGPVRQMFLYHISVLPEYRRRSIGSALIRGLEQICRDEGFAEMFLLTNRSNAAAMRLYASTVAHTEGDDEQMFIRRYANGVEA